MLIDTHAHLWWPSFADAPAGKDSLEQVLLRAKQAGVEKIIAPGTNIPSSLKAIELAKKYSGIIYPAVGIHPEETSSLNNQIPIYNLQKIIEENRDLVVAIGEIGIDGTIKPLDQHTIERQGKLFREQCEIAIELDLPVIIHTRESFEETWEVLSSLPKMPRGQFHCFSVNDEAIKKVIKAEFYVSFCGNITWSKRVAKLVPLVPDDRLLLETDSPFMIPRIAKNTEVPITRVPQGSEPGDRNEPAYVADLAQEIAKLRDQTVEQIEKITTENANRLYKL